jgi:hypothetical protein
MSKWKLEKFVVKGGREKTARERVETDEEKKKRDKKKEHKKLRKEMMEKVRERKREMREKRPEIEKRKEEEDIRWEAEMRMIGKRTLIGPLTLQDHLRELRVKGMAEKEHEYAKLSFQLQLGEVKAYERDEVVRDPLVVRYIDWDRHMIDRSRMNKERKKKMEEEMKVRERD